ncbi:MAG: hypothetical protein AB7T27_09630 [Kiritimatiellia bacterium]
MTEVNFNCPRCKQSMEAPGDMVGESIKCPACGQLITIPQPPTGTGSPQEKIEVPISREGQAKIITKRLFKRRSLIWIIPAALVIIVVAVKVILLMNPLYRMPEYWELKRQTDDVRIIDIRFKDDLSKCRIEYSALRLGYPESFYEYLEDDGYGQWMGHVEGKPVRINRRERLPPVQPPKEKKQTPAATSSPRRFY